MFYLVAWIALIGASLLFSLLTFVWALRNGQFEDQERARFFPLFDLPPDNTAGIKRRPLELYMLSICVVSVCAALGVCIVLGIQAL